MNNNLTSQQSLNLTPEAKTFASMATAMGYGFLLRNPKGMGKGKGQQKGQQNGQTRTGNTPGVPPQTNTIPLASRGGIVPVKEGGKAAVMEASNGSVVPIHWLCHDCHSPHHNPLSQKCVNCRLPRNVRHKVTNLGLQRFGPLRLLRA